MYCSTFCAISARAACSSLDAATSRGVFADTTSAHAIFTGHSAVRRASVRNF